MRRKRRFNSNPTVEYFCRGWLDGNRRWRWWRHSIVPITTRCRNSRWSADDIQGFSREKSHAKKFGFLAKRTTIQWKSEFIKVYSVNCFDFENEYYHSLQLRISIKYHLCLGFQAKNQKFFKEGPKAYFTNQKLKCYTTFIFCF